ncbi:MAG TPA: tetratricopeptide repeat protein [Thermoanaerobaculaceae bacterium]|nr:tetratricopeptide repeat protein [Thermoanaerobaculaceae bacterium]
MKRNILIIIVLLVVVVIGAGVVVTTTRRTEWTTSSAAALAQFENGLAERDKLYYDDARAAFTKAVELDPNFLMAKYFLWASLEGEKSDPRAAKLLDEFRHADLSKLTDRERFLVEYSLAADDSKDPAAAEKILTAYAAKHPDDPYVLERKANLATARQDWPEAHRLLARLIDVAPNRVVAYNQLGYLEMGQGRFADAQKMFETYRYIAPDQANPHDSLGELFILLGKYGEARQELEAALRIKPDFCASYEHLVRLALMQGKADQAEEALDRARHVSACQASLGKGLACVIAVWRPLLAGDWEGVWKAQQASCPNVENNDDPLQIWVAARTGRNAEADAFVKRARERLEKLTPSAPGRGYMEAFVAHAEGVRLLLGGEPAQAAEKFRFADRYLTYRQLSMGIVKLANRVELVQALEASGAHDEAATALAEARAVNPSFVDTLVHIMAPPASD